MHKANPDVSRSKSQLMFEAGVFCGEGCVSITYGRKRRVYHLRVQIANTDPELVRPFLARWGGSLHRSARKGNSQPTLYWMISGKVAAAACRTYAPFAVGRKRRALEIGIEYGALLRPQGFVADAELVAARQALRRRLRRLNDPYNIRSRSGTWKGRALGSKPTVLRIA